MEKQVLDFVITKTKDLLAAPSACKAILDKKTEIL